MTAIRDWFSYHSSDGRKLRAALRGAKRNGRGRVMPGEWARYGITANLQSSNLHNVVQRPDPIGFLISDSVFHQMCDVDPEVLRIVLADPDRARQLQANLKKKKPPVPLARGA